jgi:hypothetical protein
MRAADVGQHRVFWVEMTSPKLSFNSEVDTSPKYQSSGKIKHNGVGRLREHELGS